jgi:hypothetical protein
MTRCKPREPKSVPVFLPLQRELKSAVANSSFWQQARSRNRGHATAGVAQTTRRNRWREINHPADLSKI